MGVDANMLRGRILVAEDEVLICMLLETILSDAGYEVLAASSVEEALGVIDREAVDAAILDINLHGKKVYPVAEKLTCVGKPFLFATGGGDAIAGFPNSPFVAKPFREEELLEAMDQLLAGARTAIQ
jgi:DNA-binding response OmpR family regulator